MKRDAPLVISSDRSLVFGHDLRRAGALTLTFSHAWERGFFRFAAKAIIDPFHDRAYHWLTFHLEVLDTLG